MHPLGFCLLLQKKPLIDLRFLPAGPEVLDQASSNEVREPGHDVGFSLEKMYLSLINNYCSSVTANHRQTSVN